MYFIFLMFIIFSSFSNLCLVNYFHAAITLELICVEFCFCCFFTLQPINGFGVAKVLDSGHPNFSAGDLVWGTTGWEEYSLIQNPEKLKKIHHTDVPLTHYTGILGNLRFFSTFMCCYGCGHSERKA